MKRITTSKLYILISYLIYIQNTHSRITYTCESIPKYIDYINKIKSYPSHSIHVYDKNQTLNKTEVLKIKNKFNLSYYCKNDICVQVDRHYLPLCVEIPDENGNIKRYISKTYTYDNLKSKNYFAASTLSNDININIGCTSDSQCLSNKCINGICIFNEENPIEFCTDIYRFLFILGGKILYLTTMHSYMHCGKVIDDTCKTNNECATKKCLKDGSCGPRGGPSDTDGLVNH